eukprot:gnl/TRDRNA2_/TRDRNA2_147742_c1_seq1.p1 gnl/TRDRNA2_/TRDRNA2_147742_c1~~gnl/TRDRNA2_/TRDRNA2_147742_c1_seq1.p1  ORF type:complete len:510 (-),score=81.82 gnl/TRDRNA2_/TRDRNA2_147742_c1_seq1:65-1594(-)
MIEMIESTIADSESNNVDKNEESTLGACSKGSRIAHDERTKADHDKETVVLLPVPTSPLPSEQSGIPRLPPPSVPAAPSMARTTGRGLPPLALEQDLRCWSDPSVPCWNESWTDPSVPLFGAVDPSVPLSGASCYTDDSTESIENSASPLRSWHDFSLPLSDLCDTLPGYDSTVLDDQASPPMDSSTHRGRRIRRVSFGSVDEVAVTLDDACCGALSGTPISERRGQLPSVQPADAGEEQLPQTLSPQLTQSMQHLLAWSPGDSAADPRSMVSSFLRREGEAHEIIFPPPVPVQAAAAAAVPPAVLPQDADSDDDDRASIASQLAELRERLIIEGGLTCGADQGLPPCPPVSGSAPTHEQEEPLKKGGITARVRGRGRLILEGGLTCPADGELPQCPAASSSGPPHEQEEPLKIGNAMPEMHVQRQDSHVGASLDRQEITKEQLYASIATELRRFDFGDLSSISIAEEHGDESASGAVLKHAASTASNTYGETVAEAVAKLQSLKFEFQ